MKRCVYCGGEARPLWRVPDRMFEIDGDFAIGRCTRCATILLLDDVADLSRHYPEGDYYAYEETPTPPRVVSHASLRRRLLPASWPVDEWLARTGGDGRSVLDVGCGAGAALDTYRARGYETFGVEPDARAAERARERGHRVTTGTVDDFAFGRDEFSVVRFRHSLEHVADPAAAARNAVGALRPGGRLLIEIPNAQGFVARVSGPAWWQLDPPRHVALPPRPVLERLMASLGCPVELRQTYTFGQGIAASLIFRAQQTRRGWAGNWRLRSTWRPSGYRALTIPCYAAAAALDLIGAGDSLRLVFRKPAQ